MIDTLQQADFEKVETDATGKFSFTMALNKLKRSIVGIHNKISPVFVMNDVANPVNVYSLSAPNPQNGVIIQLNYNTSTNATVGMTTSATLRTFITGYSLSFQSNVTCDNTVFKVLCTPAITGLANTPISWEDKLSVTATDRTKAIDFSNPIEIKKSTNITVYNFFSAGASQCSIILYGYTA